MRGIAVPRSTLVGAAVLLVGSLAPDIFGCDSAVCDLATERILECLEETCALRVEHAVCRYLEPIRQSYSSADGRCRGSLAEWAERIVESDCGAILEELGFRELERELLRFPEDRLANPVAALICPSFARCLLDRRRRLVDIEFDLNLDGVVEARRVSAYDERGNPVHVNLDLNADGQADATAIADYGQQNVVVLFKLRDAGIRATCTFEQACRPRLIDCEATCVDQAGQPVTLSEVTQLDDR